MLDFIVSEANLQTLTPSQRAEFERVRQMLLNAKGQINVALKTVEQSLGKSKN